MSDPCCDQLAGSFCAIHTAPESDEFRAARSVLSWLWLNTPRQSADIERIDAVMQLLSGAEERATEAVAS